MTTMKSEMMDHIQKAQAEIERTIEWLERECEAIERTTERLEREFDAIMAPLEAE